MSTLLQVLCESTGMGFAVVARQPAKRADPRTVLMFTRFAHIAMQLDLKKIQDDSYAAVHDARAEGELRD